MPPRRSSGPRWRELLPNYPDVNVEIISDYMLTDIVADRYDAGVRLGEQVDKDMIAVPIGPRPRQVGRGRRPAYFKGRPQPMTPRDLTEHACINLRLPTHGGFFVWDFRKDGQDLNVRVHGRGRVQHGHDDPAGGARTAWALPTFRMTWWRGRSETAASCTFSRSGAHLVPAITSTIRAAANPRRRSRSSWMPFGTEHDIIHQGHSA